jgi:ECF transporter S component (folate family)
MTGKERQFQHPGQWVTLIGFCVAMEVILARFLSFHTWNMKIGLSFIPVAAAAMVGGPLAGGLTGALGDLIGATLFPAGPYFPGFTFSSFLDGLIYGLFLYQKNVSRRRIMASVILTQVCISLLLNTFWLSLLFHTPMNILFWPRLFQCAVGIITKLIVLSVILPPLQKRIQ